MELITNQKYWSLTLTFIITVIVFLVFSLLQGLVLLYLSHIFPHSTHELLAYSNLGLISLISACVSSLLLIAFIRIKNRDITGYLNLSIPRLDISLIFMLVSFVLMFFGELVSNFYPDLFETEFAIKSYKNSSNLPLLYLGVVCFGPIFEEFVFRGFLFKGLERSFFGGHGAVFISSILFAALHVQYGLLVLVFILFPLSMVLGYARLKSGSLLLPICIHMMNNLVTCIITHFEVY